MSQHSQFALLGTRRFLPFFVTQLLGAFNDNIFKQSLILAILTCGIATPLVLIPSVIGIIEGIIYLTKSDEEFVQTYITNRKPWF